MTEKSKLTIADALPSKMLRRISESYEILAMGKIVRISILEITMIRDFVSEQQVLAISRIPADLEHSRKTHLEYCKLFLQLQDLSNANDRLTPLFFGTQVDFAYKTNFAQLTDATANSFLEISNPMLFLDWLEIALIGLMTGSVKYSVEKDGLKEVLLVPDKNLPLQ